MIRINRPAKIHQLPTPEEGLRALRQRLPQAEAKAALLLERVRPLVTNLYAFRRRIGTITVLLIAAFLLVHVMFGANGMIVYKQKRSEYESLQKRIAEEKKENDLYTQRIQGLKTDAKAIEKEAREQLRYVRPGEYVYVPPAPPAPTPGNHSAKR